MLRIRSTILRTDTCVRFQFWSVPRLRFRDLCFVAILQFYFCLSLAFRYCVCTVCAGTKKIFKTFRSHLVTVTMNLVLRSCRPPACDLFWVQEHFLCQKNQENLGEKIWLYERIFQGLCLLDKWPRLSFISNWTGWLMTYIAERFREWTKNRSAWFCIVISPKTLPMHRQISQCASFLTLSLPPCLLPLHISGTQYQNSVNARVSFRS